MKLGRIGWLGLVGLALVPLSGPAGAKAVAPVEINILKAGAHGDGKTLDTKPIQRAIDKCSASGGGTLRFPAGSYLTGTIRLKNDVCLQLDAGAVLLGSPRLEDYPETRVPFPTVNDAFFRYSLVYAERARNTSIVGQGRIDGQGGAPGFARKSDKAPQRYMDRPSAVRFVQCTGVRLRDIGIHNAAFWVAHLLACDDVVIDGVKVESRTANYNNDGLDIDCCSDVRISNCFVNSVDDAICLKATGDRPCRNITVTNCVLTSSCSGIRFGCEAVGSFQDITISNCVIYDTRQSAIQLQTFDGGNLERVCISGITMRNVGQAIFVNVGYQLYGIGIPEADLPVKRKGAPGKMRDVIIRDIQADGVGHYDGLVVGGGRAQVERKLPCIVSGMAESPIEGITFENIRMRFAGKGTAEDAQRDLSALPNGFNCDGMGIPPAYAFYCRYINNLRMANIDVSYEQDDLRPALFIEQSKDLDLSGLRGLAHVESKGLVCLRNVDGALIHGCRPTGLQTFLYADGGKTAGIALTGNDLRAVAHPVVPGPDLNANGVQIAEDHWTSVP